MVVQNMKSPKQSGGASSSSSTSDAMRNRKPISSATPPEEGSVLDAHNRMIWRAEKSKDFSWSDDKEPHMKRRSEILSKHPEIKDLYRPDPLSSVFCLVTVAIQITMAYYLKDSDWWVIILCAWTIGGTMNHSLVLAMHELSHDLWFPQRWMNQPFAFLINCPTCVASAATFKRYHLEHHSFQGSDKMDADIPTKWEGYLFRNSFTKLIWVALQPFFYGFRPIVMKPKPVSFAEILNWVVVGTFDFFVVTYWGPKALLYLFLGSILGLGLHPMAGHFIAEHFEFIEGQETYSYYGPLNFFAYNVGYHNEHHDFPRVPGRLLPKVRELAPEFYNNLPYYDSWTMVLVGFVMGKNINCFSRIKRSP